MSNIYANNINPRSGTTVTFPQNIKVLGTATYEDVANVDSVGIITARSGIVINTQSTSVNPLSVGSKGGGTNDGHLEGEGPKISFLATRSGDGAVGGAAYIQQKAIGDLSSSYPVDLAFGVRRFGSSFEAMRILSTGSIGIGTDNPGSNLHVKSSGATEIRSESTGNNALISINNSSSVPWILTQRNDTSNGFSFRYNGNNYVNINNSGRMLIGTINSSDNLRLDAKLAIVNASSSSSSHTGLGMVNYSNNASVAPFIDLKKSRSDTDGGTTLVSNGDDLGYICWHGADGDQFHRAAQIQAQVDSTPGNNDMPGRLIFSTTSDGALSPTERMRITSSGMVALGGADPSTASTSSLLYVIAGSSSSSGTKYESKATSTSTRHHFAFTYGSSTIGTITTQNNLTQFNTSSDYRLKENLVDIEDGIARVKQLSPKRFNFITSPEYTVDGFIAHEAQTIVPEAVTGTHNGVQVWEDDEELPEGVSVGDAKLDSEGNEIAEYQGIDTSKLVPLLTAALQEAITKIETLEQRLTDAGL